MGKKESMMGYVALTELKRNISAALLAYEFKGKREITDKDIDEIAYMVSVATISFSGIPVEDRADYAIGYMVALWARLIINHGLSLEDLLEDF